MDRRLGFIGLGKMGTPIASRLAAAGWELTVFDVRRDAMGALRAEGARPAGSPAEVASASTTVLLSLPTPDVVRHVVLGGDGVVGGDAVETVIDLSTTGATTAREIAAALAARGVTAVDAPVSGGVAGAIAGKLAVMVACPRPTFDAVAPLLGHLGRVFFVGERPGMGQTMKLVNNLLSATALAATSEAVVLGVGSGLDPAIMLDVLNAGSGRNSATEDKFPKAILPRTFDAGFAIGLMCKDLDLCLAAADAAGVPMPLAGAVRDLWRRAREEIGPEMDFTRIVHLAERAAGIEVGRRG
jgi:3-hydroxyisobutyrate dehydrogenase-like beta-hydroxyacid dehydrogenase